MSQDISLFQGKCRDMSRHLNYFFRQMSFSDVTTSIPRATHTYATTRTPPCRALPWDGMFWSDSVTLSHVRYINKQIHPPPHTSPHSFHTQHKRDLLARSSMMWRCRVFFWILVAFVMAITPIPTEVYARRGRVGYM